jgi:uncharacterized membrane protein
MAPMKRRPDPTEDARQWRLTDRLAGVAFGLAILVIVLLAHRLGIVG